LGFSGSRNGTLAQPEYSKAAIRAVHSSQRREKLRNHRAFIKEQWPLLKKHFANGSDIKPSKISPRLELIDADSWQSRLFRLATLTWSVPVSCAGTVGE
jgi:hypothetical protein